MERYSFSMTSPQRAQGEEDTVQMRSLRPGEAQSKDAAAPAVEPGANAKMSVIGKTLVFKGELTANEDLLIQGRVEGTITHSANHLAIGANGDVTADVRAQRVIIQGKLEGDVRATESVTVEVSANVHGNIFAPRVSLKDGAKFKGNIDMDAGASDAAQGSKSSSRRIAKPKPEPDASRVNELLG
jgi:cytoskeletal protein CcmA (bactofilin family)